MMLLMFLNRYPGYYFDKFQPDSVRTLTVENMAAQCRTDILDGWLDTGIKCGIIGEVGCSWPLTRKFILNTVAVKDGVLEY